MRVRWLDQARFERSSQILYIAFRNPVAAVEQDDLIGRAVDRLEHLPKLGRSGRRLNTRELVVSRTSFVVIYRIVEEQDEVQILRVLHGKQKWPPESAPE